MLNGQASYQGCDAEAMKRNLMKTKIVIFYFLFILINIRVEN